MFKSLLVVPPPPAAPVIKQSIKPSNGRMVRVFSGRLLIAPSSIPRNFNPNSQIGAPPDVTAIGMNGQSDGQAASPLASFLYPIPTAPAPQPPKAKPVPGPIRVGTGVAEANLINKVMPVYPALAKAARIQGTVEFSATISKDGVIENLQLVRGQPMLVNAAREAVLQWRYRSTRLNGQPVEVLTQIVVNFTLAQ